MNINKLCELLTRLYHGDKLSDEDLKIVDDSASILVNRLENDEFNINVVEDIIAKNALESYIDYYEDYSLRESTNAIVNKYYSILYNNQKSDNNIGYASIKPLVDNSAIINTITIVEIVVSFGIFIALLLLALL